MNAKHTDKPWWFSKYMSSQEDTKKMVELGLEPTQAISNDGSRYLMAGDRDGDYKRIALVDCQTAFKRGKGYQTACAERDANALLMSAAPDLLEVALLRKELRGTDQESFCRDHGLKWKESSYWELDRDKDAALESTIEDFLDELEEAAISKAQGTQP